jgi:hypothetical protein
MRKLIAIVIIGLTTLLNINLCVAQSQSEYNSKYTFSSILGHSNGLRPEVLATALTAYNNAVKRGIVNNKHYLSIIDYSIPPAYKRLWVIDLHSKEPVFFTYVSQGKNSGEREFTNYSNKPGSQESSIGVYLTKERYYGKHGAQMVLSGLDPHFNTNAESRGIVMHGAEYVSPAWISALGRVGRSWGCPAVQQELAAPIIDRIKNGSVLVAYYPDRTWLHSSPWLKGQSYTA